MKIALAQIDVKLGQIEQNYQKIAYMARLAKKKGAQLAAFGELCLSGYLMSDRWNDESFTDELMSYDKKLLELSKKLGIALIYGNVYKVRNKIGHDGRTRKYNAAHLIEKGKIKGTHTKRLLPNYRIFDDSRYFYTDAYLGNAIKPFKLGAIKIGLEVCEELWYKDYEINPTKILIERGAQIIVNVSASPFSADKYKARNNRIKELKKALGKRFVPFYYVNCAGVQNNGKSIVAFDGDSRIYDADGNIVETALKPYEEGLLISDFNAKNSSVSAEKISGSQRFLPIEQKFMAIKAAYRGMDETFNRPKYVFGLSGGIDSCLNAALCKFSINENRIYGYNLPAKFNGAKTKNAAKILADNLNVKYEIIPIDPIVKEFRAALGKIKTLTLENLQARVRAMLLMAKTSELANAVLINNTNKVELALGYGALYGDLAGAWSPIADLTKTEIWEMARLINKKYGKIIPQELIPDEQLQFKAGKIKPSAELKKGQIDPMIWGFDDWLLEQMTTYKSLSPQDVLNLYIDGGIKELCKKYGLQRPEDFIEHCEWFFKKFYSNAFKRFQAPPVLVLSKSAFGQDFRESQYAYNFSKRYLQLKNKILKK